jgi:hypothetical protein
MKPLARKRRDGWVAAVTLTDGRVKILSPKLYDNPASALLHAQLWISARIEKAAAP